MAEEEKNQEEKEEIQEEKQEEVSQEDLAAQWEQMVEGGAEDSQEDLAKEWEQALQEQKGSENLDTHKEEKSVSLTDEEKLVFLMDIPLEISVEIGSTTMPIEEVLKLNPNSVVELDKFINQPVDLKINGRLVAQGELYTVKNQFGIKITNIITPEERMKLIDELL